VGEMVKRNADVRAEDPVQHRASPASALSRGFHPLSETKGDRSGGGGEAERRGARHLRRRAATLPRASRRHPDEATDRRGPVSLREPGNTEYTTQATMTLVNLATNIADRSSACARSARTRPQRRRLPRKRSRTSDRTFPRSASMDRLAPRRRTDGPTLPTAFRRCEPGDLERPRLRGAMYMAGRACSPIGRSRSSEHGLGLNITLESYAGSLDFGLLARRMRCRTCARSQTRSRSRSRNSRKRTLGGRAGRKTERAASTAKRARGAPRRKAPAKKRRVAGVTAAPSRRRPAGARRGRSTQ